MFLLFWLNERFQNVSSLVDSFGCPFWGICRRQQLRQQQQVEQPQRTVVSSCCCCYCEQLIYVRLWHICIGCRVRKTYTKQYAAFNKNVDILKDKELDKVVFALCYTGIIDVRAKNINKI